MTRYRAMVCGALTGPDALDETWMNAPQLQPGEVRIAIRAVGVNYPDLLMTRGQYQLRLEPPFVPGMELAGEIIETGQHVSGWLAGDRVSVMMRHGAYAEQAVAPAAALIPLPAAFGFAEGATFHVAAKTAYHALVDRGRLDRGETLLVLGATGGVGLTAVELGKMLGARVIAVGSDDDKLAVARPRGADAVVNYRKQNLREAVETIAGSNGVDVIYDPVGGEMSRICTELLAWNGRLLVVGFASGDIPSFPADHARLKGYSIVGLRAGEAGRRDPVQARRARAALLQYAEAGRLRPHVCVQFPLHEASQALKTLEERAVVGRVALIP
ncbi:NADPH:quinone oxidoreductase family protein [Aquisalimonas sp.]|uniref:NADPH:quinone oxidoreductase family protein n=1 Tax=Aquisalimonas sp. TaxID=1872621 RepID=UPI0025C22B0F|nr:NADPH:quinone oxidoreductase family protein [Aquisalimonas sp.]